MSYENLFREKATLHIGLLKRWLCFITGVDTNLLERCPESEEKKFTSLGAAMFITTALSFVSAWIAIDYIFPEIGESTFISSAWKLVIKLSLATVWSLIIFNLQRFIVSGSSRISDSDGAGFEEFVKSLPGIILSIVIGLSIAMPLEVAIFKPEVELHLSFSREKERIDNEESAELASYTALLRHCSELIRIDQNLGTGKLTHCLPKPPVVVAQAEQAADGAQAADTQAADAQSAAQPAQANSSANTNTNTSSSENQNKPSDADPTAQASAEQGGDAGQSLAEDEPDSLARKVALEDINKELAKIEDRKAYDQMMKSTGGGLVKRVRVLFDKTPFFAYSVLLIIIFIQLTPVLIKAMASKSPYDYLEDMQSRMVLAHGGTGRRHDYRNGGIEPKALAVFDEEGKCTPVTISHYVEEIHGQVKQRFNEINNELRQVRLQESGAAWQRLKRLAGLR